MNIPATIPSAAAEQIGNLAAGALLSELHTWPKPGLVSPLDSGSHEDMDAGTLRASAEALRPFFVELAVAGAAHPELAELRTIGQDAETAMLTATGGINTHRGAIFGLGLLCAAAGATGGDMTGGLGRFVHARWGADILAVGVGQRWHGAGGARAEAAAGFPHVYRVGLPAWKTGHRLTDGDENASRVQACFALIATVEDTNLLHRGGVAGLRFAQRAAREFLQAGGVGQKSWLPAAERIHRAFVTRKLSPGGSADLLAATLFVGALEIP